MESQKVTGCIACQSCSKNGNQKCIIETDGVNEWIQEMKETDGIIFGSPTYFAGVNGTMKSFLDRAFYVSSANNNLFRHKVGIAVAAVRRFGGLQVMDQLNKYIQYTEMLMPVSNYWNVIHGAKPEEVLEDPEGVQIMELQGENMAWLLKILKLSKGKIEPPQPVSKLFTNFIR